MFFMRWPEKIYPRLNYSYYDAPKRINVSNPTQNTNFTPRIC